MLSFQNFFILTEYHMFWLSYGCFSIFCNAFLLKVPFPAMCQAYKVVGTQLSLFTTFCMLFFQFIFALPARYVRMHNVTGKSKQMQAASI